jgi:hypothetical protein
VRAWLASQEPTAAVCLSGLSKPRQAVNATRHSSAVWLCTSMKRGMIAKAA